ncbi:MAG: hypothetical protein SXV54_00090 [Chloroflexota bacterium]|nr:hypothetical protein [Chloroflexota bacterium]
MISGIGGAIIGIAFPIIARIGTGDRVSGSGAVKWSGKVVIGMLSGAALGLIGGALLRLVNSRVIFGIIVGIIVGMGIGGSSE